MALFGVKNSKSSFFARYNLSWFHIFCAYFVHKLIHKSCSGVSSCISQKEHSEKEIN